ncbi:hypothetical protein COBT_000003 [Conglomerata obtusa]
MAKKNLKQSKTKRDKENNNTKENYKELYDSCSDGDKAFDHDLTIENDKSKKNSKTNNSKVKSKERNENSTSVIDSKRGIIKKDMYKNNINNNNSDICSDSTEIKSKLTKNTNDRITSKSHGYNNDERKYNLNDCNKISNDEFSTTSTDGDSCETCSTASESSEIEQKIKNTAEQINNLNLEINSVKKNLLTIYLINLHLYKKLKADERSQSVIKQYLIKITVALEKIIGMEDQININKEPEEEICEKRLAPKGLIANKGLGRIRKREEMNPRVKNKKKAEIMMEKGKRKIDGNIDTKKSKSDKYK